MIEVNKVIEQALNKDVEIGRPRTFEGLTVFPLVATGERAAATGGTPGYLTLDQALSAGTFRVTEIGESGTVPELQAINDGDLPVLLLDGEELVGAKQNRVLNVTVLCPAGKTIVIPVSCVEQGRWGYARGRDADFLAGDMVMYSAGRSAKYAQVAASLARGGGYTSDQRSVWDAITRKSQRMRTQSPTSAMRDVYRQHRLRVEDYVAAFPAEPEQIGAVFALGAAISGVELFGQTNVLQAMLPKLVRSYALDAMEVSDNRAHEVPGSDAAQGFVGEIVAAKAEVRPGVGLGQDVRLKGKRVIGGALIVDEDPPRVAHLSGFRVEQQRGGGSTVRESRLWRGRRSSM